MCDPRDANRPATSRAGFRSRPGARITAVSGCRIRSLDRIELRDDPIALRPWRAGDAPAVHAACQDREIQRWLPDLPRPYGPEDARAFITDARALGPHPLDPGPYQCAITKDGNVVGSIALRLGTHETGHLGYWCAPEARGQGITPRALRGLCRYALEELQLERLDLVTDIDNIASQRVAEKVGFRREGVLRSHLRHPDGHRRDSVSYSLLPGELR